MKLYAERPMRLIGQIVFDVGVLAWIWGWWLVGQRVNNTADASKVGAVKLQNNADNLSGNLSEAGQKLRKVPLVGDTLQSPFDKSSAAAKQISLAGQDMAVGIDDLGDMLSYLTVVTPVAIAVLVWAIVRIPYARKATQASKLRTTPAGVDVLALRALQTRSAADLLAVSGAPATSWRTADATTTNQLAGLYLSRLGLKERSRIPDAPDGAPAGEPTSGPVNTAAPQSVSNTGPTRTAPLPKQSGTGDEDQISPS